MDYKELRSALLTKGKAVEDRKGHHVFFFIEVDNRAYRATKFSHNARGQVTDAILGAIARQMRLSGKELRDFVDCALSHDEWIENWRKRGSL